ncbi:hypothetical protein MOP88_04160 [Sphingomonas sp. WKB10]|nr:hypothetical protein [Sphingomonas sp. WKB10]
MPAPHLPALLWKIERLVNDEGDGCTASWSIDYVEPMLRDARRLLGGDAGQDHTASLRYRGEQS